MNILNFNQRPTGKGEGGTGPQVVLARSGLFKEVILENMPDPHVASESVWLPFLRKFFGGTKSTRFYEKTSRDFSFGV